MYDGQIDVDYLPAGVYDVYIQAKTVLRSEKKEIRLLKLKVLGPFYLRPWFIALMVSLLIAGAIRVTALISTRAQRKKELRNELERRISDARIEALQSQMSPHFIFNALNSIQNLILNEQVDASLHYLNQFAILTRYALEKSSVKWISLEEELNFLQTYMDLENLRFQHEVDFQFEVDPAIDLQNTFIPPLLIQPLLENAFKHAYSPFMDSKTLNISIDQQGGNLEITIEDNGKGISDTPKKHRKSKGLFLLRERLELLYQYKSTELKITSSENSGTRITLKIPIDFARDNP
jgi:LytS/YehU family sensor histidine kinase